MTLVETLMQAEIERLREQNASQSVHIIAQGGEIEGLREEVKEISGGAGVYMGLLVDCIAVLHTIEPESDYEAEKLRDLLDAIDRALEPTRHKGALL